MSGFLDNFKGTGFGSALDRLSRFGMIYDDLLIKNSKSIGYIQGELKNKISSQYTGNELLKYSLALSDTTSTLKNKAIAFFQLDYKNRIDRLRDIASNSEIEFAVETISNDLVVYDDNNRFCFPIDLTGGFDEKSEKGEKTKTHKVGTQKEIDEKKIKFSDKVLQKYEKNFDKIYNAWGFNTGDSAWMFAYQFLVDGFLSFEIIYDNPKNPKDIIGFKEIDPSTISPQVQKDSSGKLHLEWIQLDKSTGNRIILKDSQVIYISFSNSFKTRRISYVERLIRSFNLVRVVENSKVIWHTMNAPIRLKTTVPIGSKSIQKAWQDVREYTNLYKEDIFFNQDSGEVTVDGEAKLLYYKNYVIPQNDQGQNIDISALEYPGPNLSDSQLLNYFSNKLKNDSKIPYSRYDSQNGMGEWRAGAEGITRDEIRYGKFIKRLRTVFQEIIIKPLYIQMCLDVPALKDDPEFKNNIGIRFNNDNLFEEMKDAEVNKLRMTTVKEMADVKDGLGQQYFSTEYLLRRFGKLTDDDVKQNDAYKRRFKSEITGKPEEGTEGDELGGEFGGGFGEEPTAPELGTTSGAEAGTESAPTGTIETAPEATGTETAGGEATTGEETSAF